MARWLGRISLAISLILSIAVVVCWVRSGSVEDRIFGTRGDRYWQVTSAGGRVRLVSIEGYPATVSRQWQHEPRGGPAETHGKWLVGDRRMLLRGGKSTRVLAIEWSEGNTYADGVRSPSWKILPPAIPTSAPTPRAVIPAAMLKAPEIITGSQEPFLAWPSTSNIPPWLSSSRGPSLAVQPWMTSPWPEVKLEGADLSSISRSGGHTWASRGPGVSLSLVPALGLAYRSIVVPYWMLIGIVASPMWLGGLAGWGRWARALRRRRKLLCVKCGYDLRGGGERCPECGEVTREATLDTARKRSG